uniref:Uncharacterized protein n=1 Tax=Anguilla anguilla TaxID=7936 RepID=A0A0E9PPK3_ANGAN
MSVNNKCFFLNVLSIIRHFE